MRDFLDTHKKDANSGIVGYTCTQLLPPSLSCPLSERLSILALTHSSSVSWLGLRKRAVFAFKITELPGITGTRISNMAGTPDGSVVRSSSARQ